MWLLFSFFSFFLELVEFLKCSNMNPNLADPLQPETKTCGGRSVYCMYVNIKCRRRVCDSISNLLMMWSEGKSPNLTFNKLESSRNNGNSIHKNKNSGAKYANIWSDGVPSFFFFFGFQILVFTADKLRPKLNTELELGVEQQVGSSLSTPKGYGFESSKKQYQVSCMIQASLEPEVHY